MIREAAILAGLINADELLSSRDGGKIEIILREMRAETESMRLTRAVAASYGLPLPWPDPPTIKFS